MGQSNSLSEAIPETVEQLNYEVKKHAKVFSEIGTLNYDDFQKCLSELNELFVSINEKRPDTPVGFSFNFNLFFFYVDRENV